MFTSVRSKQCNFSKFFFSASSTKTTTDYDVLFWVFMFLCSIGAAYCVYVLARIAWNAYKRRHRHLSKANENVIEPDPSSKFELSSAVELREFEPAQTTSGDPESSVPLLVGQSSIGNDPEKSARRRSFSRAK